MTAYDGFFIVDKPSGVTSFAMVGLLRRLTGVRRVGHAGTLDPLASGVLPVAVGHATRLIEYTDDHPKTYVARVRFGAATDTYDADGEVVATGDASKLRAEDIAAALPAFEGDIQQTPPRYSAIKLEGKPLYRYAREGVEIAPTSRTVHVERIELRAFAAETAEIAVRCRKGTYVRSIAHDLGERLGCGAHLAGLVRSGSGGFSIEDAHAPEALRAAAGDGRLIELMLAADRAVERLPAGIFDPAHTRDVLAGRDVHGKGRPPGIVARAYSTEGAFLGMLRSRGAGFWHPEKVLGTG
ncbi:MAG: tRNA pseudouridine(55) synthase TruB [Dehalococcoidia bacterium]